MAFHRIRPKSGTAEQWERANTVLGEREIGYEYPPGGIGTGVVKMKMGDGKTAWNNLPYAQVVPLTEDDIVEVESTSSFKIPSIRYVSKKFKDIDTTLKNKIISGTYKDAGIIISNPDITFKNGVADIPVTDFENAIGKTMINAMAQLKSASSAVVTSCRILDSSTIQIKCANASGTPFDGRIAVTILIFVV